MPGKMYEALVGHLFPGDGDEHGAAIAAGLAVVNGTLRFLARKLFFAVDGVDYVPGKRGYRMLKADFIAECISYCREHRLAYFAIHNHGGEDSVAFSTDDIASHERGYPALLDLTQGMPVGALVFARNAVAGDIWFPAGARRRLNQLRVLGHEILRMQDRPSGTRRSIGNLYARQALMFGEAGQQLLKNTKVGVIGAGGVGSLVIEYLARLGVGCLVVADPDRIETSNLSRIVGAHLSDAGADSGVATSNGNVAVARLKVDVANQVVAQANVDIVFRGLASSFAIDSVARQFLDCDFLFLAADTMQARLVFNALVHQYYIPGIQIGAKVVADQETPKVEEAYSVYRWVLPGEGCLWCNGLISRHKLALEAKSEIERTRQAYGTTIPNPSVITLNAVGAACATNDFLLTWLGISDPTTFAHYRRFTHVRRDVVLDIPDADPRCPECGNDGRLGKGDSMPLPTLQA